MSSFSPTDLLSLYSPTGGQCLGTVSLTPPSSVQSSTNNHDSWYNIIAGSSFTVFCRVEIGLSSSFDFYINDLSSPIGDDTLPDTTISKYIARNYSISTRTSYYVTLTFNNFQAAHNGLYICQAEFNYGTEPICIGQAHYAIGEQCHCALTDCGGVCDGWIVKHES